MAKSIATSMIGWMPKVVEIETLVRDIAALNLVQAQTSSSFQSQIDHHNFVRDHLVNLYQHTFDGVMDDFARQAHLALRKHKLEDEGGLTALFLILSDDFDANFAHAMKQAGTKAYQFAEPAMGKSNWGELKQRASDFADMRSEDLKNVPEEALGRVQASILRGLAAKEPATALQRRLDEGIAEAKEVEGGRMSETEATITLGTAVDSVMKAAGFDEKRWLSQRDDRVRHSHEACDKQGWIPLGKSFSNGLRYPGDANGPIEELVNCRCVLIGRKKP